MCRSDISAAIRILCRKTTLPGHHDWKSVKKLDRYLKKTMDFKLKISAGDTTQGWLDTWVPVGIKTQLMAGQPAISCSLMATAWSTALIKTIEILSTAETESTSTEIACSKLEGIIYLLKDFGTDESKPIISFDDNEPCMAIRKGESTKSKSRIIVHL